jgi:hypothetical protein
MVQRFPKRRQVLPGNMLIKLLTVFIDSVVIES